MTQKLSYTFDAGFDEVFNNLSSNKAPSVNPYDKSWYLTRFQEELVLGFYKGTLSPGFEVTEEMRRSLSSLVRTAICQPTSGETPITDKSSMYLLPENLWFITYEGAKITTSTDCSNIEVPVTPITQDELWKVINNPFRGPTTRRALRLDIAPNEAGKGRVELVSEYPITEYKVRYLEKLSPIILTDLSEYSENLYIDGVQEETVCKLDSSLHAKIIEGAAKMALLAWSSGTATS